MASGGSRSERRLERGITAIQRCGFAVYGLEPQTARLRRVSKSEEDVEGQTRKIVGITLAFQMNRPSDTKVTVRSAPVGKSVGIVNGARRALVGALLDSVCYDDLLTALAERGSGEHWNEGLRKAERVVARVPSSRRHSVVEGRPVAFYVVGHNHLLAAKGVVGPVELTLIADDEAPWPSKFVPITDPRSYLTK